MGDKVVDVVVEAVVDVVVDDVVVTTGAVLFFFVDKEVVGALVEVGPLVVVLVVVDNVEVVGFACCLRSF